MNDRPNMDRLRRLAADEEARWNAVADKWEDVSTDLAASRKYGNWATGVMLLILAFVAVLILSGCGSGPNPDKCAEQYTAIAIRTLNDAPTMDDFSARMNEVKNNPPAPCRGLSDQEEEQVGAQVAVTMMPLLLARSFSEAFGE